MRRRTLSTCLVAATLAGCGFEPLYGRFGEVSIADELATVRIGMIGNRSGQILRNYLLDRLTPRGEPARPAYTLTIDLVEPLPQDLAIARDESILRYAYSSVAVFKLADAAGKTLLQGSATGLSSYEVTNSEFATVAGQSNARSRVLEEIANEVKVQLAVFLRTRRGDKTGDPLGP